MSKNLEPQTAGRVLDVDATLARLGGDRRLFCDILGFFLEDAPPLLKEVHAAADRSDASAIRSTAHALKGLAAGCGGVRAAQAAQRVEHAGELGDLDEVESQLESLDAELELLQREARRRLD